MQSLAMKFRVPLGVLFLLACYLCPTPSNAEGGCPNGEYPQEGPGWRTCIPFPQVQGTGNQQSAPRFKNSWGAIAVDADIGALGTTLTADSRDDAVDKALSECKQKGGANCTVMIKVSNACMAMALATNDIYTEGGTTTSEAETKAIGHCKGKDARCSIYFSGCSVPVRLN